MINNRLKETDQMQIELNNNNICKVSREDPTFEKRRIDILIETEMCYIIIENKIYASDQPEQMISYITDVNLRCNENGKKIFCIYLTPFHKEISELSFKDEEKKYIDGYLNLTYADDILPWLNSLETKNNEQILRSAIIQYKDMIEGLTNKRQIFEKKRIITEKAFDFFFHDARNPDLFSLMNILSDCYSNSENSVSESIFIKSSLPLVIYAQFILDLQKSIMSSDDVQKRNNITLSNYDSFKLFCGDNIYNDSISWLDAVKKEQEKFGIEWQSPNPDVKMYFMFANEGTTSAYKGYKFSKQMPHDRFKGNPRYDTPEMTYELQDFINKKLLLIYPLDKRLIDFVVEKDFIKPIKEMENLWK